MAGYKMKVFIYLYLCIFCALLVPCKTQDKNNKGKAHVVVEDVNNVRFYIPEAGSVTDSCSQVTTGDAESCYVHFKLCFQVCQTHVTVPPTDCQPPTVKPTDDECTKPQSLHLTEDLLTTTAWGAIELKPTFNTKWFPTAQKHKQLLKLDLHNNDQQNSVFLSVILTVQSGTRVGSNTTLTTTGKLSGHAGGRTYAVHHHPLDGNAENGDDRSWCLITFNMKYSIECDEKWFRCHCDKPCDASGDYVQECDKDGFAICTPGNFPNETALDSCHDTSENTPCGTSCDDIKSKMGSNAKVKGCSLPCGDIECSPGYRRPDCIEKYDCSTQLCYNNGTCVSQSQYNADTHGFYRCSCVPGYSGAHCTKAVTTAQQPATVQPEPTVTESDYDPDSSQSSNPAPPTAGPQRSPGPAGGVSTGAIIAIVGSVIAVMALVGFIGYRFHRAKKLRSPGDGGGDAFSSDSTARVAYNAKDNEAISIDNPNADF